MGDSILVHTITHGRSLFSLGDPLLYEVCSSPVFFTVVLGCNHKSGRLSNSGLCKMQLLSGEETSW